MVLGKIDKIIPWVTKRRSKLPSWISISAPFIIKRLKTLKKASKWSFIKLIELKKARNSKPINQSKTIYGFRKKTVLEGCVFSKTQK